MTEYSCVPSSHSPPLFVVTVFWGKGVNSAVLHWNRNDPRNRWKSNFQTPEFMFDTLSPVSRENPKASPNGETDPKNR